MVRSIVASVVAVFVAVCLLPVDSRAGGVPCPAGTFGFEVPNCTPCFPGTYSKDQGSPSCDACPVGTANPSAGSSSADACIACAAGTFNDSTGSAVCVQCGEGTYSDPGATSCTNCNAGTYSSQGSGSCVQCDAGTFSGSTAAICSSCAAGTFSDPGASQCTSCPAGKFSSPGAASCTSCLAGSFSDPGASQCTQCYAGTYSSDGAASCTSCDAGTFSGSGAAACTSCGAGTYSGSGADECTNCSAGTYSDPGAQLCTSCAAGTFSDAGASQCSNCSAGTFSGAGASECSNCSAGTYSGSGADECTNCDAGTFSGGAASECTSCNAGTYSDPGSANCATCTAGSFSLAGASQCTACGAGTFQDTMGADSCSNCDPGTFSGIGASECTDCAAGSYSSEAAASECTGCSAGTYSGTGASVCSVCVAGTYSDPGASTCTSCPAGKFSGLGAGVCTPCSPGTFQDNAGSPSCDDCPPGTFELSTGASVCTDCPGGAETPCNGHGTCSDGPTGLGTCTCTSGYTGAACENNVGDTTTTTTTADTVTTSTLEPIGACCAGTGCFEISRNYCEGEFQGSYKGDASSCDEPLICSNCGDGCLQFGETCDDGDTANGDGCDSKCSQENCFSCSIGQPSSDRGVGCYGPSVCFATRGNRCTSVCGNGALEPGEECDDGNTAAGDCCAADCTSIGGDTLSPSCRWIVCAGSPDGDVRVRSGRGSTMNANACGDTAKLAGITSGSIVTTATIVSTAPTGEGIRFYGPPEVDGDIVTGGASVRANLYLTIPGTAVKTIDGGMTVAKDPLGMVDTTGSHALVSVCSADQAILAAAVTTLDGMASNLPDEGGANGLKVPAGGSHPIDVTGKGIAVVDMAALKLGHGATLTLKGGPTDVVMLVVNGRLKLGYHSAVVLDGLVPANVLFYGKGARCRLSPSVTGSGTVFCPEAGRYVIGVGSMWTGTFLGGAKEVQVRLGAHLTHAAFTGF